MGLLSNRNNNQGLKRAGARTRIVDLDVMKRGKMPVARKPTKSETKKVAAARRKAK